MISGGIDDEVSSICANNKIKVIAYNVLENGLLTGKLDKNSSLDSKSSKIYNCIKDNISSYDYWVEGKDYMWKLKCVWKNSKFVSVKNTIGTEYNSSDLCRKSFESFNPKIN